MSTIERDDKLYIGASWYPEMWPEEEWPKDIARMQELGFNIVRVFEFAWHKLEPSEENYQFDWAQRLLDLCHEGGIAVMLGTPTAAPPAWLTSQYPEVLQVTAQGNRRKHGQRKHGSHVSARYRDFCKRITQKMVEQLGTHPAVQSWQIDNEMSGSDYSEEAHAAFHHWLKDRYGSIERLNEMWGLNFWSQAYSTFEQVPMPTASVGSIEVPERHHPSLIMAVARFNNDQWTGYIKDQCDEIRATQSSNLPITSNMTSGYGMHWYQHNKLLDRVGHSVYKDVEHYQWNVQTYDRMRGEKPGRPYWLLETAPNWSGGGRLWNIHHDEAGLKNMTWTSVLLGGSMVLYWQWRQHWAGQEMQHGTCVTATGKWRPNKAVWTELAAQFKEHGDWLLNHPPKQAEIALVNSNEAAWGLSIDPIDEGMNYGERFRDDFHLPVVRKHYWRDIINETADLSPYKVLLMPMLPIVSPEARKRLTQWVEQGGRLLLGPYTGYRSEEFTCFKDHEFGGLEGLIGARSALRFTPMWVEDTICMRFDDGLVSSVKTWCEAYEPTTGKAIAHYDQPAREDVGRPAGYGHEQVAAVYHQVGQGAVITLGSRVDAEIYLAMVKRLADEVGIYPLATGGEDVVVIPRADGQGNLAGWGLINTSQQRSRVTIPQCQGKDVLSGESCAPDVELAALQVRLIQLDQ